MALVMGITLPAGLEIIYNKTLRMYDISVFCNVGKNPRFFPRKRKLELREISYLFAIAQAWANFTDEQKTAWKTAGDVIGEHGYNLYVQDKSYRIKHLIGGDATPSIYHQYLIGHLNLSGAATSALIVQYNKHRLYWPCSFKISFKSNLSASGPDPYARLKLIWTRYYTGQNIEETETIEIPLSQAWTTETKDITIQPGSKGRWRLEIELNDVQGDLYFDNPWVEYRGQVNTNDAYCDDVVKWWEGVNLPVGATLETIYPTGGAL
ncbi:MAG: hypothetical protein PHS93_08410 [Candidatus Omnitrophica bacterium]|nr:hypothetical protein [Candidatus Omnitrophota bacterium]